MQHREKSAVFSLYAAAGNAFGLNAGTIDVNLSDGYWLMLDPLAAGRHTIEFGGQFGPIVSDGVLNVTYTVDVGHAVPLPPAALAGLPLLGFVAWVTARKRRATA